MSDSIYTDWYPRTYYILRNKTSGKKYIGQTRYKIPGANYFGSGKYWINHCRSHGGHTQDNIEVLWSEYFYNKTNAKQMLNKFEKANPNYELEENVEWANLVKENTDNNAAVGNGHIISLRNIETWANYTDEERKKRGENISKANKGRSSEKKDIPRTEKDKRTIAAGTKKAMDNPDLRNHLSQKAKARCNKEFKERTKQTNAIKASCIYCGFETYANNLSRHQNSHKCTKGTPIEYSYENSRQTNMTKVSCIYCGHECKLSGLGSHQKGSKCKKN